MEFIPHPLTIPVGLAVGVLVAAPVGPVNILCIQRALERGVLGGIAAGLGAVLGDGLIALFAALGVGAISGTVSRYRDLIQMIGGLAIVAFGLKLWLTAPRLEPQASGQVEWGQVEWAGLVEHLWDVPKTFFLTITNPAAVLGLVAIFGGISSFVEVRSTVDALAMVASIMIGSMAWWVLLSTIIGRIRHRIDTGRLRVINISAGALLVGFGALLIGELAFKAMRLAWEFVRLV